MFWTLFLCHLIADYPLQTDAMVHAKKRLPGLTLHVAVHLVTMVIVMVGMARLGIVRLEWHSILSIVMGVTVFHFVIDVWKNVLSKHKPQWVIGGYLQDQILHVVSLLIVTWFVPATRFVAPSSWILYASGYVLVTHMWFVTERVLTYRNKARQQLVTAQRWPRMVSRAILFTLLLLGWRQVGPNELAVALLLPWPYASKEDGWRFFVIDLAVVAGGMLFMRLTHAIPA